MNFYYKIYPPKLKKRNRRQTINRNDYEVAALSNSVTMHHKEQQKL